MRIELNRRIILFALALASIIVGFSVAAYYAGTEGPEKEENETDARLSKQFERQVRKNRKDLFTEGRQIFRFDTFGDEAFWGDTLKLHRGIEGSKLGGVGPGVSPRTALAVGLKVDVDALPEELVEALEETLKGKPRVDLDDPATTLALLKLNAVVGVTGFFNEQGTLRSIGIQCALCLSTVDDSLAPGTGIGIGGRLDGWANRDLNVGAIVNLSPDLSAVAKLLGVPESTVRTVLLSWGPGKFDAEVFTDGKAFRPDSKPAATLIPPAFGLAGVNLHTWTGWGSVTHWNAFVANLEMHGKGTFFDPRLDDASQFPIAAANNLGHVRSDPDLITSKLAALGRAGTCIRRRRSQSTISRPTARPTSGTGPRRLRACSPTTRAASSTTAASRRCWTSSTTTTAPASATAASPLGSPTGRRLTSSST